VLEPTGVRPGFSDKLEDSGTAVSGDMFEPEGPGDLRERMSQLR
jgi:hypothetical protein